MRDLPPVEKEFESIVGRHNPVRSVWTRFMAGRDEATCNGSDLITSHLTSGYSPGDDVKLHAGKHKCEHGGFCDDPLYYSSTGINKDGTL